MLHIFLCIVFVVNTAALQLGCMTNATFISSNNSVIYENFTYNHCCCLLSSENASGLNYDQHNQTCELFVNFTIYYELVVKSAAQFCFIVSPPTQPEISTVISVTSTMASLTTSVRKLQWNSTGITVATGNNNASVLSPFGVFVDDHYDIYIAEKVNSRVSKWSSNPNGLASSAVFQTANGVLNAPPSLYVDSLTGGIYVADESNHRVMYFANGSTNGSVVTSTSAGVLPNVNAIFLDPNRTIFITDSANNRIYNWKTNQTVAGGNGAGANLNQFNGPKRFFIDKDYSFYIPDSTNRRVMKWTWGATTGQLVAGGNGNGTGANQLGNPLSTVVSSQGDVLVCDSSNNRIQRWSVSASTGETVAGSAAGTSGAGPTLLNAPTGMAIDKDDNLYVVDGNNKRIQRYDAL